MINLTELTNFPPKPEMEIVRDHVVAGIAGDFNANCQRQMVIGKPLSGKTNLLAQFASYHSDRCISYFVTDDPWTQKQNNYLLSFCNQLTELLGETSLPIEINLDNLKGLFSALVAKLNRLARQKKTQYFFVVDGLEWSMDGIVGERILDALPQTFPIGPFLLLSCRESDIIRLPSYARTENIVKPLRFSQSEAIELLSSVGFPNEDVKAIHTKHEGHPGSIAAVYKAKKSDPNFSRDSALQEYDRVIEQQVKFFIASSTSEVVQKSIEYLSVSPTGLQLSILAELLGVGVHELGQTLHSAGSSIYEIRDGKVEFQNEITRRIYAAQARIHKQELLDSLLDFVRQRYPREEFLLTSLYLEARDYKGLQFQLSSSSVLSTVQNPSYGVSSVLQRLRAAAEMAHDEDDSEGLLRWNLGISAIRSFIDNSINHKEIQALIAIGESKEALRQAYCLTDETNRIRFIAQVYTAMRASGERVSIEAKEELKTFVNNLRLNTLDEKLVEELALDIFPVLPDVSISILEASKVRSRSNGVIDLFALALSERDTNRTVSSDQAYVDGTDSTISAVAGSSPWFEETTISELEKEINDMEITEAKELFVRQWCLRNKGKADLGKGIKLWLETIKSDINFNITLRALRQISGLLLEVPIQLREKLVHEMRVPGMTSLDSPKQEWIRFGLNLCEALKDTQYDESLNCVGGLLTQVLEDPLDLDIKTFCLASINSTLWRCFPEQAALKNTAEEEFHRALYSLLSNSADQYEILFETIGAIASYDLEAALVVTLELNTNERRMQALRHILRVSLLRRGGEDILKCLEEILQRLMMEDNSDAIIKPLVELRVKNKPISLENIQAMFSTAKTLEDSSKRALAIANLAVLALQISSTRANEFIENAVQAWSEEEDLWRSLFTGFELVSLAARINRDYAKELYQKVKDKYLAPGAPLATGNLGPDFINNVELAIRALAGLPADSIIDGVKLVEGWISQVPARWIKGILYGQLASSLYRADVNQEADRVVRVGVLPTIEKIPAGSDRRKSLLYCFPVIHRYDPEEADNLCANLRERQRDSAWYSTLLWDLTECFLSDLGVIGDSQLKVQADRPKIRQAIETATRIKQDDLIRTAVEKITYVIEQSFVGKRLNPAQALDLLENLDEWVRTAIPDANNIKHEGYLVVSQAEIHRVRTVIFQELSKTRSNRGLKNSDIKKRWELLVKHAEDIPNVPDRVFVMTLVARALKDYRQSDSKGVTELLNLAEQGISSIPALLDRLDRLEVIANAWHTVGDKSRAEFAFEQAVDLLQQFEGKSRDTRLRAIVQTAYTIGDAQLASRVTSQLEESRPFEGMLSVPQRALVIEKLCKQPEKITKQLSTTNLLHEHEIILQSSVNRLLESLVVGKGKLDHPRTLNDWLLGSRDCHSQVIMSVCNWVIENWTMNRKVNDLGIFSDAIELDARLAKAAFAIGRDDALGSLESSFAGLSSRYVIFEVGEVDRAQEWLCRWITDNTEKYLKICDPYFGYPELSYLACLPAGSKALIVTTEKHFTPSHPESIRRYWQSISTRAMPFTIFTVIPVDSETRFHDRVVITDTGGLDLGGSLNGLGKSRQKIAVLSYEDSRELEEKYLRDMLDSTNWLMDKGVNPTVFTVGQMPEKNS